MFFDSHAHLDDEKFDYDRLELIPALKKNGISFLINASSDVASSRRALQLCETYDFIYAVCGVHPHETETMTESDFDEIKRLLCHPKCVGLGEIGLDYYYDTAIRDKQRYWFLRQLEYAAEKNLPVVIHDRDAHEECVRAVSDFGVRGEFHCYSGSEETAKELLRLGFYLSFNGVVTFRNAKKSHHVIRAIPMERLLIETDCPYLTPEPFRGRRNDPSKIRFTAQTIADLKNVSLEDLANITRRNAATLFGISAAMRAPDGK